MQSALSWRMVSVRTSSRVSRGRWLVSSSLYPRRCSRWFCRNRRICARARCWMLTTSSRRHQSTTCLLTPRFVISHLSSGKTALHRKCNSSCGFLFKNESNVVLSFLSRRWSLMQAASYVIPPQKMRTTSSSNALLFKLSRPLWASPSVAPLCGACGRFSADSPSLRLTSMYFFTSAVAKYGNIGTR